MSSTTISFIDMIESMCRWDAGMLRFLVKLRPDTIVVEKLGNADAGDKLGYGVLWNTVALTGRSSTVMVSGAQYSTIVILTTIC